MSAYQVSDKHIDFIVTYAVHHANFIPRKFSELFYMENGGDEIGRMLVRENARSVAYRYNSPIDQQLIDAYRHTPTPGMLNVKAGQILKAIAGLRYQSCEHPEWESSGAAQLLDALERHAITTVPGYEEAEWSI